MEYGDMTIQDEAVKLPANFVDDFTYDLTTATGTQEISTVGYRPSSIIFTGIESASQTLCWGFSDGTTDTCFHLKDNGLWVNSNTACLFFETQTAGNNRHQATIQSFDDDGFTLSWVKNNSPTGTATIKFMAFK